MRLYSFGRGRMVVALREGYVVGANFHVGGFDVVCGGGGLFWWVSMWIL